MKPIPKTTIVNTEIATALDGPFAGVTSVYKTAYTVNTASTSSGVQNPKWLTQVRNRGNATTERTADLYRIVSRTNMTFKGLCRVPAGYVNRVSADYGWSSSFGPDAPSWPQPALTPVNGATNDFYAKAFDTLETADIATYVAELKEALTSFAGVRLALTKLLSKSHAYKAKTKRGRLKELSGSYLSVVFGMSPAIRSSFETLSKLEAIDARGLYQELQTTKSAAPYKTAAVTSLSAFGSSSTPWSLRVRYHYLITRSTRTKGGIFMPQMLEQERLGVDPLSWVRAGWEIIPYSFIVDYMIPIGRTLEALSFRRRLLAWVSQTTRQSVTWFGTMEPYLSGPPSRQLGFFLEKLGQVRAERKRIRRTTNLTRTLPGVQFTSSPMSAVNAFATLATKLNAEMALKGKSLAVTFI